MLITSSPDLYTKSGAEKYHYTSALKSIILVLLVRYNDIEVISILKCVLKYMELSKVYPHAIQILVVLVYVCSQTKLSQIEYTCFNNGGSKAGPLFPLHEANDTKSE